MTLEAALAEALRPVIREELARALAPKGPDMLTTEQAAAELGVAPKTIRRRIKTGEIVAERHGGEWRIRREALTGPGRGAASVLASLPSGR